MLKVFLADLRVGRPRRNPFNPPPLIPLRRRCVFFFVGSLAVSNDVMAYGITQVVEGFSC